MRRILQAPSANFRLSRRKNFVFPLFIGFLLSACSLPPQPRLINKPVAPQRPQKARPATPRETRREHQEPAPSRGSISTNKKISFAQPLAGIAAVSSLALRKNTDERLLSALGVFLNAPYELGGVTPAGVDCSGLVKSVFAEAYGFNLPHNAASQFQLGASAPENNLRLGDLVFFETSSRRGRYISHVGIYLANRRFAHASTKAGVIVSGLGEAYWRSRYAGARRLIASP